MEHGGVCINIQYWYLLKFLKCQPFSRLFRFSSFHFHLMKRDNSYWTNSVSFSVIWLSYHIIIFLSAVRTSSCIIYWQLSLTDWEVFIILSPPHGEISYTRFRVSQFLCQHCPSPSPTGSISGFAGNVWLENKKGLVLATGRTSAMIIWVSLATADCLLFVW